MRNAVRLEFVRHSRDTRPRVTLAESLSEGDNKTHRIKLKLFESNKIFRAKTYQKCQLIRNRHKLPDSSSFLSSSLLLFASKWIFRVRLALWVWISASENCQNMISCDFSSPLASRQGRTFDPPHAARTAGPPYRRYTLNNRSACACRTARCAHGFVWPAVEQAACINKQSTITPIVFQITLHGALVTSCSKI